MALELEPKRSGVQWKSGTPVSCELSVTDADSRVEAGTRGQARWPGSLYLVLS